MYRPQLLRFAAIASLVPFAYAGNAQASQVYNVQSDWANTYGSTTALNSATSATWGPTATGKAGWSAGEMSWNWTNGPMYTSGNGFNHAVAGGPDIQNLTTYYLPSTGHETSGSATSISNIATYNYTVPFQAIQLNPGAAITEAVGQTVTEQLASGFDNYAGGKMTLPTGWTSNGAASGTISEVGHVESIPSSSSEGFTTTGFNLQKTFTDGGGSVPAGVAGVFYNYGANVLSTNDPMFNAANSALNNTVTLEPSFGPAYVAWTAPNAGTASISMNAWDTGYNNNTNDGVPAFYVITSTGGPTAPLMSVSNLGAVTNGSQVGGRNTPWTSANNTTAAVGSVSFISQLPSYTAALGYQEGFNWTATVTVTAGEVLYFVADADHTNGNAHSYDGSQDPVDMQNNLVFTPTPEPTSLVLCGLGAVGLFVAASKRRRRAA